MNADLFQNVNFSLNKPGVGVQSVIYKGEPAALERALEYLDCAAGNAIRLGIIGSVCVLYGDCSPEPVIDDAALGRLREHFRNISRIDYIFFNNNLGSAAGHNRLLEKSTSDLTVIQNPDVLVFPNIFQELSAGLSRPGAGLVEARQVPIEHPKDFDPATGETSWASTACAMGPTRLFQNLSGFDSESFFLYCDDVDFSWRVRLAGRKVIHQCSAMVFHDKRLDEKGHWIASEAEKYYSAEAAMILPFKYYRKDIMKKRLSEFSSSGDDILVRAADAVKERLRTGRMPTPIDPEHLVGQFIEGAYATHRFSA
jgi:GT2 family glycosyltransferase